MIQLTETTKTLLQLLVDCDAVQAGGTPNEQGLCDAIDNDGCHYQSSALAGWLEVAHKAGIRPMLRLEKQPNVPMSRARTETAEACHAGAPRLDGRVKPL